jgi:hypothetical protein
MCVVVRSMARACGIAATGIRFPLPTERERLGAP